MLDKSRKLIIEDGEVCFLPGIGGNEASDYRCALIANKYGRHHSRLDFLYTT